MRMRDIIEIVEAIVPLDEPTDNVGEFIRTATDAIHSKYGDVFVRFNKIGRNTVRFQDPMQGARTRRDWNIIKDVSRLAKQAGIAVKVHGAGGQFPWR